MACAKLVEALAGPKLPFGHSAQSYLLGAAAASTPNPSGPGAGLDRILWGGGLGARYGGDHHVSPAEAHRCSEEGPTE
jgi:hypothetical protein